MGISGAMTTAVSGLMANATSVARISENIANANTVGYKRTFADMVTQSVPGAGAVSGVKAVNGSDVSSAGMINSTGSAYDMAVSGSGFFVVSKNPDDPMLSNYFLTRAGGFTQDDKGYLVNSAGYYLAAYELDPQTGVSGPVDRSGFGGLSSVRISDLQLPAEPTTTASVSGNLPAQETGVTPPGAPFLSSMEFYTQLGRNEKMTLSWQPTDTQNSWDLTISDSTGRTHGVINVRFQNAGTTPGAPESYTLVSSATGMTVSANGEVSLTVNANDDDLPITLSLGEIGSYTGIQQFVGDFTPQKFTADGSGQTLLARTETDQQGIVWGVFEDGRRIGLYEVPLAQVTNPDGLTLINGNAYQAGRSAGDLMLSSAGTGSNGVILSGALEGSTVEVATELTDLIRIQRAYSSNAKIITAADEMLQEINNLKR